MDKVVERAKCLFDRSQRVESMDLLEINVIGPKSLQAVFDFMENSQPGQADLVSAGAHPAKHLRREHQSLRLAKRRIRYCAH